MPRSDTPCQTPYVHKDVLYAGCTVEGAGDGKAWCPTKVRVDGSWMDGDDWEFCPQQQDQAACRNDEIGEPIEPEI